MENNRAREAAIDAIETIVAFYLASMVAREVTEYCELPEATESVPVLREMEGDIPDGIFRHADAILTDYEGENLDDIARELALSVEVRSGWQEPGYSPRFDNYRILFSFGGPNVWFHGDLDHYDEPSPYIEVKAYWGNSAFRSYVGDAGVPFAADALEWFVGLFVYSKI